MHNWKITSDNAEGIESAWQLLSYVTQQDRGSLTTANPLIQVLMSINDGLAQNNQTSDFKDKWRAIWQAFNVLQYAPRFSAATQSGLRAGLFKELLAESAEVDQDAASAMVMDSEWLDVHERSEGRRVGKEWRSGWAPYH